MSKEIKRIRYVVEHFQDLQGLRLIPFAIFFLIGAVFDASLDLDALVQNPRPELLFLTPIVLVLCVVASRRIGRWYEQRYGYVEQSQGKLSVFRPTVWFITFGCGLLVGLHSTLLLILGLYLLSKERPSRHIPSAIIFFALAVNWPGVDTGFQDIPATTGLNTYATLDLILAAVLASVGLYNHWFLQRHLAFINQLERAEDE